MARTNNLTNFLTDVATAIKSKTGKSTSIPAANFDTEIMTIETGGTYQSKTVTISANGDQTITPDQGYDAIDQIVIQTRVPIKTLQVKSMQITSNMNVEIEPDSGYDGFSKLNLEVNVPGSTINNQDKTITQNGTYTADSGYTGIGTAIVNVKSPIRLFNSIADMEADTSEDEGEYAVVYGHERTNYHVNDSITTMSFPEEIVLSEPYTSSNTIYWELGSQCSIRQDRILFQISSWGDVFFDVGVEYTSTDGQHYTRTSFDVYNAQQNGYTIVFPVPLTLDYYNPTAEIERWISECCFIEKVVFTGMYEWKNEEDPEYFEGITGLELVNDRWTSVNEHFHLYDMTMALKHCGQELDTDRIWGDVVYNRQSDTCFMFLESSNGLAINTVTNKMILGCYNSSSYETIQKIEFDPYNGHYIGSTTISTTLIGNRRLVYELNDNDVYLGSISYQNNSINIYCNSFYTFNNVDTWTSASSSITIGHKAFLEWHHVTTDFTLEDGSQIENGISALGKYGPVVGDGSIASDIDLIDLIANKEHHLEFADGVYISANSASINRDEGHSIQQKVYSDMQTQYSDNIPFVKKFVIPDELQFLFGEQYDASMSNSGLHTFYLDKYIIKVNVLPDAYRAGTDVYILDKDFNLLNSTPIHIDRWADYWFFGENGSGIDKNKLCFRGGYNYTGAIDLTTFAYTAMSSTNMGLVYDKYVFSLSGTTLSREDSSTHTKTTFATLPTNCTSFIIKDNYIYCWPSTGTGRKMYKVQVRTATITTIDLPDQGQCEVINSNAGLYFGMRSNNKAYKIVNDVFTDCGFERIYWHPSRTGYGTTCRIVTDGTTEICYSWFDNKVMFTDGTSSVLMHYDGQLTETWSSESEDPILIDDSTFIKACILSPDYSYIMTKTIDFSITNSSNTDFTLVPTGRHGIILVLPNKLVFNSEVVTNGESE